ncbi:MAG: hypothetical protein ACYTG0_31580, partial [Planctomycetota bacterium]
MSQDEPTPVERSPNESPRSSSGQADLATSGEGVEATIWQKSRWYLLRMAAFLGAFLLLLMLLTAGAAWYTSRPEFCRSCHNMEPY